MDSKHEQAFNYLSLLHRSVYSLNMNNELHNSNFIFFLNSWYKGSSSFIRLE